MENWQITKKDGGFVGTDGGFDLIFLKLFILSLYKGSLCKMTSNPPSGTKTHHQPTINFLLIANQKRSDKREEELAKIGRIIE